jgi:hypothetical protein
LGATQLLLHGFELKAARLFRFPQRCLGRILTLQGEAKTARLALQGRVLLCQPQLQICRSTRCSRALLELLGPQAVLVGVPSLGNF